MARIEELDFSTRLEFSQTLTTFPSLPFLPSLLLFFPTQAYINLLSHPKEPKTIINLMQGQYGAQENGAFSYASGAYNQQPPPPPQQQAAAPPAPAPAWQPQPPSGGYAGGPPPRQNGGGFSDRPPPPPGFGMGGEGNEFQGEGGHERGGFNSEFKDLNIEGKARESRE